MLRQFLFFLFPVLALALYALAGPVGGGVPHRRDLWPGEVPQFVDLNGDGALDLVGFADDVLVRDAHSEHMRRVAAYDGKTGERLWSTPYLGSFESAIGMRMGLVHDHVVVVDAGGEARVFKAGGEAPLWTMNLGERLAFVCNGDPGQVVLETVDGRGVAIDLASGATRPATAPSPCATDAVALPAVIRSEATAREERSRQDRPSVEGMRVDASLDVSPEVRVVLGDKTPGTRVPMVAVLRGGALAWASPVPAHDPLRASGPTDDLAAADDRAVFVLYELAYKPRVAAFDLADGRRMWDVAIPERVKALVPVQDRVYVVYWTALDVLDCETGELRHRIGEII